MKRILFLSIALSFFYGSVNAQLFTQDFSSSTVVTDYASSLNPTSGMFNAMTTTAAVTPPTTVTIENGALRFNKTSNTGGIFAYRNYTFATNPTFVQLKMEFEASSASAYTSPLFSVYIGSAFSSASTGTTSAYASRFGILMQSANTFKIGTVDNIGGAPQSATFSGKQTITFVVNNSGGDQTYTAPDASIETVANGKMDVWIGTTRGINDFSLKNTTSPLGDISGFKIQATSASGLGIFDFDNIEFKDLLSPTWTGGISTDWTDASNWINGVPNSSSNVTIAAAAAANQPTITSNVSINSMTIASGALNVASGNLTVTGPITTINSGTMTIENNANLIQGLTGYSNRGNVKVKRNSNSLKRLDYTIWSSPVTNASLFLKTFSPLTLDARFYNYNEGTNLYNAVTTPTLPAATAFTKGAGYLIRMPDENPLIPGFLSDYYLGNAALTYNGEFNGVPNNGTITKAMTYLDATHGYNMVGNPYPSTIDANAFITANSANIESTLYFWRKTNNVPGTAYASYNSVGPVATGSGLTGTGSEAPNGTIQVGQGFFVKAKSAVNLTFTNDMRLGNAASTQFFKTKQVAKDRVWLNLTNASGVFSQALIGYLADATLGVDSFDGKYINDSPIALTSNINNEEYTIQGRPTFDVSDVVALIFKTDADGDYTIALDHFDGVFASGQDIYLLDSKTGIETDLKAGSYSFAATAGVDNARFSLKYQKTLKVDAPAFNENSVRVYKNNGALYVNSGTVAISNIKVFDVQGRLLAEQKNVKATSAVISNLRASNQVLIVTIAGEDNSVVTKKVVN